MSVKDALKKVYCIAKHPYPMWFYVFNRPARRLFVQNPVHLTTLQQRIVKELDESGISFTTLEELFADNNMLETLTRYKDSLGAGGEMHSKKTFLHYILNAKAPLDLKNPFIQLSLSPTVLGVASSYLRMLVRLKSFTLNLTLPVPPTQRPEASQRWHRDPQELKQMKIFIYLTDVTPDRGPFAYLKGSNYGNTYGKLFPQKPPAGNYPPEGAVEKTTNPADVVVATGKAGTVIFCDTSGLHRGGYATGGERIMYTGAFMAPSWIEKPWYGKSPNWNQERENLSFEQRFALHDND